MGGGGRGREGGKGIEEAEGGVEGRERRPQFHAQCYIYRIASYTLVGLHRDPPI